MIKVQHLHKTIGQKEILSDISVEIKKVQSRRLSDRMEPVKVHCYQQLHV